jgi:ribosomal protein S18 acetylase RimI-like enzyme
VIHYQLFSNPYRTQLIDLLLQIRPAVFRLSSRLVYQAITRKSVVKNEVVIFVALENNTLVGYVIAAKKWSALKRKFFLKYPAVGFQLFSKLLINRMNRFNRTTCPNHPEKPNIEGLVNHQITGDTPRWSDERPEIAKIIHVGVHPAHRSKGIASGLYAHLTKYLKDNDFQRVDAHIDFDNRASVRMHQRSGWEVRETSDGFLSYFEL